MSQNTKAIIGVMIIVFIIGGCIYFWQKNKTSRTLLAPEIEQLKMTPEVAESEIEWLTYRNDELNYSIKYPANWRYVDNQKSTDPALINWVYFRRQNEKGNKGFDFVSLRIYTEKSPEFLEQSQQPEARVIEVHEKFYVLNYMANNHIEETKNIFDQMIKSLKINR